MTKIYCDGDLLNCEANALINTVNCVGVMGAGLALDFKQRYAANYLAYRTACNLGCVVPGKIFPYRCAGKYILNFPTKVHWRDKSVLTDIISGLQDLRLVIKALEINSIAIVPLGCGLGGLATKDVVPAIFEVIDDFPDVKWYLYGFNQFKGENK